MNTVSASHSIPSAEWNTVLIATQGAFHNLISFQLVKAYSGIWGPPSSFLQGGGNCNCSEKRFVIMDLKLKTSTGILSPSWTISSSSDGKTNLKTILKLLKLLPSGTGMSWRKRFILFSSWRCLPLNPSTHTRVKSHSPCNAYLEWKVFQYNRLDYQEPLQYKTQSVLLLNLPGRRVLPHPICTWVCFNNFVCWKIKDNN